MQIRYDTIFREQWFGSYYGILSMTTPNSCRKHKETLWDWTIFDVLKSLPQQLNPNSGYL